MCAELVILLYNLFPSEMSGEQRLKKTPLFPIAQKITSFFPPVTLTCFPENTHLLPGEMLLLLTCLPSLPSTSSSLLGLLCPPAHSPHCQGQDKTKYKVKP